MKPTDMIGLIIAFILIWFLGFMGGISQERRAQFDISISETDHSVETDHHAHQ